MENASKAEEKYAVSIHTPDSGNRINYLESKMPAMNLYRVQICQKKTQTMTDILNDPIKALTEYVSYPSVSLTPFLDGICGAREFAQGLGTWFSVGRWTPIHPVLLATRGSIMAKTCDLWTL